MGKWDEKTTDMVSPTALNGFLCPTPWTDFAERRHMGRCEGVRGHYQPPLSCLGPDPPLVGPAGGFGVPGGGHAWVARAGGADSDARAASTAQGRQIAFAGPGAAAQAVRRQALPCAREKLFGRDHVRAEEDLKAGGRFSGHATPLQPRSRRSVGIILLREVELLLVQGNDTSSSGPSTA